jgi:hypothetical protein
MKNWEEKEHYNAKKVRQVPKKCALAKNFQHHNQLTIAVNAKAVPALYTLISTLHITQTMKFSTALIGLFRLFAPSIKAGGNLFDQDQDPSAIADLIEWDDDVVKRDSDHQRIIGEDYTLCK